MLYLAIRTWKEIPVLWPAYGLFSGHESRNGTRRDETSSRVLKTAWYWEA